MRQRGAISILAAATLMVAALAVALAVDIGRLVHERQRLQGAADAAALAGARALAVAGDPSVALSAAQEAAERNGYTGALGSQAGAVLCGHLVYEDGLRSFEEGPPYNAVAVQAHREVPRSLVVAGLLPGEIRLGAYAVAHQESVAALEVGSFLARISNEQEAALTNLVLGQLLGTELHLSLADYENLLGASLSLSDLLAAQARVGTLEELLSMDTSLADLLELMAQALQTQHRLASVILNDLAARIPLDLGLRLGELLSLSNDEAALDAGLNVFNLLVASAQLANQDHSVDVDLSTAQGLLGQSGVADLRLGLHIIEAPQIAVGPPGRDPATGDWNTKAHTGQIDLEVSLTLLNTVAVNLGLEIAAAEAWLEEIHPATPSDRHIRVQVGADGALASLTLDVDAGGLLHVGSQAALSAPGATTLSFELPDDDTLQVGTPLSSALLNGLGELLANLNLELLGIDLSPLTQLLGRLLQPLLDEVLGALLDALLEPLLRTLGVQLAGAEVSVPEVIAGQVRLVR